MNAYYAIIQIMQNTNTKTGLNLEYNVMHICNNTIMQNTNAKTGLNLD